MRKLFRMIFAFYIFQTLNAAGSSSPNQFRSNSSPTRYSYRDSSPNRYTTDADYALFDEAIRQHCQKRERFSIREIGKEHHVRLEPALKREYDNFVICLARSTKAGIPKGETFEVVISPFSLIPLAQTLTSLAHVSSVVKCKWNCQPQGTRMMTTIRKDYLTQRQELKSYQLLAIEHYSTSPIKKFLAAKATPLNEDARGKLMLDVDVASAYQFALSGCMEMWKSGWSHGKLCVDNVLFDPEKHDVKLIDMLLATRTNWENPLEFMLAVAEDYTLFALTFSMALMQPVDNTNHGLPSIMRNLDYISELSGKQHVIMMSEYDADLKAMFALLEAGMDATLDMLPPSFKQIIPEAAWNAASQHPLPPAAPAAAAPGPTEGNLIGELRVSASKTIGISNIESNSQRIPWFSFFFLFFIIILTFFFKTKNTFAENNEHLLEHEI